MKTVGFVVASATMLVEPPVSLEIRLLEERGHRVVPLPLAADTASSGDAGGAPAATSRIGTAAAWRTLARAWPRWPRTLAVLRAQTVENRHGLLLAGARIARRAQAAGCDHLHARLGQPESVAAIVAARLSDITVSLVARGALPPPAALSAGLRHADLAIATSRALADRLRTGAAGTTIALVPCGVDLTAFAPRPPDQDDNGRWLFAAGHEPAVDAEDLLDALWHLAPVAAVAVDIAGAGSRIEALRARSARLGLAGRVRFLGACDAAWLRDSGPLYRGLVALGPDVAAEPCGARGLILTQAMAMGLPVIVTATEGDDGLVDSGCGRTVPAGDPRALAGALSDLDMLGPAGRRDLGLAGRRRVGRRFSAARQGERLSRLLEAV